MAVTSGDFSASQLRQTVTIADRMWKDDIRKADFDANVDIVNALIGEQTASVKVLADPEKDREVKIHWLDWCDETVEDCGPDDCDIAGPEVGSDSATYGLTVCKRKKFSVNEMDFRANDYNMEQAVAVAMLKADKALSESVAATAVARLESFKGINAITDGVGTPNGVTSETDVAAADWNERLFAYFYRIAIQNKFSNPFLLSGTNLFEDWLVTNASQANANGKGAAALYKMMRKYFDLFNIDSINSPNYKTYMINRGSIAFGTKHYYSATPKKYKEQDRWSQASRNIKGLTYDVFYTNRCSGNTIMHDFMFKAKYDWFLNPLGCNEDRTGVMAFNKI